MRTIDWSNDDNSQSTLNNIKNVFETKLNGKTVFYNFRHFIFLYWFPPWELGTSTHGTPNHSFISESFCFIGFLSERGEETHLIGLSFYRIVFKIIAAVYIICGLLLTGDFREFMFGVLTFVFFGMFTFGIFERSDEDDMNKHVKSYLEFK